MSRGSWHSGYFVRVSTKCSRVGLYHEFAWDRKVHNIYLRLSTGPGVKAAKDRVP